MVYPYISRIFLFENIFGQWGEVFSFVAMRSETGGVDGKIVNFGISRDEG
jgi:hypothetical protein